MKSTKLLYLLLLSVLSFTSACSDDDEENGLTGNCMPTKITTTEGGQASNTTLTYDGSNRISTIDIEEQDITGTVQYNSAGDPERINLTESPFGTGHAQYTYNTQGQLTTLEIFANALQGATVLRNTFEYNSAGQVVKSHDYEYNFLTGLSYSGYTGYAYDSKGNITKESYFEGPQNNTELAYTIDYTYDNNSNPGAGLEKLQRGVGSPNNVLTAVYKDSDGTVDKDESYTMTYTYSGTFPTAATRTTQNGNSSTMAVTYNCK